MKKYRLKWSQKPYGRHEHAGIGLSISISVEPEDATEKKPTPKWRWLVHASHEEMQEGFEDTAALARQKAEEGFRAALDRALKVITPESTIEERKR